jgi:hypothetical protein
MAAAQDLREKPRQIPEHDPAQCRARPGRQRGALRPLLDEGDADHRHNRQKSGDKTDQGKNGVVRRGQIDVIVDDENRLVANDLALHQRGEDRGQHHRYEGRQRVAADNQLEGIKRAGKGRVERGGDRRRRAAADKSSQITSAKMQIAAEPRGNAGAKLCIGGFKPNRCTHTRRQDGQPGEAQAVAQRHVSAMQRVGFNRVDDVARLPSP